MKEITYSQSGDYLLPDLALPETEYAAIGKYGMLCCTYLKTHRCGLYVKLLLSGKLYVHLLEFELPLFTKKLRYKDKQSLYLSFLHLLLTDIVDCASLKGAIGQLYLQQVS